MEYCFDTVYDYSHSCSAKHALLEKSGYTSDTLPLWVADMDFQTPKEVIDALKEAVEFGIFGYNFIPDDYTTAVCNWQKNQFGWNIEKEWIVNTPGVVTSVALAIRALTKPGEGVLIQRPAYPPFMKVPEFNNRKIVNSALVLKGNKYQIDFEDFEKQITLHSPKLFILCNPHNPVGRVWTKEELTRLGDICVKHGVIVISDEIHEDFVFDFKGYHHVPFASIKPEFAAISITSTAPSKTFNIPALKASNIFIPNPELRKRFADEQESYHIGINLMGVVACRAAYTYGADWLNQLKLYLYKNVEYIRGFLKANLPQVQMIEPEGTFLLWLNFNALGLSHDELENLIAKKARLWLNSGAGFGPEGEGFQRMNIASPLSVIQEAMNRLKTAIDTL